MKIGEDVLSKIEKLITQIDQPKAKKPRTPRIQSQHHFNNELYNKLHEEHKAKLARLAEKAQQQKQNERKSLSPFKVTNKHSIFLNTQQPRKPLHERIDELQNRKMQSLMMLKEKYLPKQSTENDEEEEIAKQMEERRKKERKYTQKEVAQKMEELNRKERQRVEKLNRLKIQMIQEHSKDFRCKPYVSKETEAHWNKYKLKKQLSTSVFQRFQQYQIDRKTHLQNKEKQVRERITPFTPKISENSRLLASKSSSRLLQVKNKTLQRSASCRCMQRRKHNGSTAMHTSRKI